MVSLPPPTDRPLSENDLQALICNRILQADEQGSVQIPWFTALDRIGGRCGLRGEDLEKFTRINAGTGTPRKLSEFVNRLISSGALSRDWEHQHPDLYYVTEYGRGVLQDFSSLLDFESTGFVESLRDPELRVRCWDVLARTRRFDSMVRDAIAVLEDRLKGLPDVQMSHRRRDVAVAALSPNSGAYTLGEDEGQKESAQLMYQGILGFFGNPVLHGLQTIEGVQARQIVGFIDTLLNLLGNVRNRSDD